MNDLLQELATLQGRIKALEDEARKHEDAARVCRAQREEAKRRVSEIQATINDARIVSHVQGAAAAADSAKAAAESEAVKVAALRGSLEEQQKRLDEKEAKLDAVLAKLTAAS